MPAVPGDPGDPALPVAGQGVLAGVRRSRRGRWRALVLLAVHVAIAAHVAHFLVAGRTLSPVEPSESMYTLELGELNAGFVFFAAALLGTALFGRFFCGWGCHLVALQDLCGWAMKRLGIRPRPFRSRLLVYGPLALAFYMFVWPTARRLWADPPRPFPGFSNHLVTTGFWETFPGVAFAALTFAVCGFAAVYFLGAKGFCTYGCPYGAFFAAADRLAPGRILVSDACTQCGHCTATCTSNVRVHEEVRLHEMVVDAGCMKCMDCVSVCPTGALRYGFVAPWRRPAAKGPARRRYDLSWGEELILAAVALGGFLAFRGLYDGPPLLMSAGLGAITAFLVQRSWRLWRDADVGLQSLRLKRAGRLRPAGAAFAVASAAWLAFAAHSGFVQWHRTRGRQLLAQGEATRDEVLGGTFHGRDYSAEHDAAMRRAYRHLELADRWGLFGVADVKLGLAWLHLLRDEPAAAEREIRAAVALDPSLAGRQRDLADFLLSQGRTAEAADAFVRAHELEQPTAAEHFRLGALLASLERYEEAARELEAAVEQAPDSAPARYNLGGVYRRMGRSADAVEQLRAAAALDSEDADTRVELALALKDQGRLEEAVAELRRAVALAPERAETRLYLNDLIRRWELESGG
jgi:tetratricopeptide (TPR) repeat protein/NAD-dependent dihydropyrimidine dehydrogenase PreA subunit